MAAATDFASATIKLPANAAQTAKTVLLEVSNRDPTMELAKGVTPAH
jgi:hypothetical protein